MKNWELHITGQVQGVGYRPMVYRVAHKLGLKGRVSNGVDGVRIYFRATATDAESFCNHLYAKEPFPARVTGIELKTASVEHFTDFSIVESPLEGFPNLLLTPDFALCSDCREELTSNNRRRGYPFTTCTNCGPRYSIVKALPYDRPRTTMAPFSMCTSCLGEYHDPTNRRHFSQTNSCPDCAVALSIVGEDKARPQDAVIGLVGKGWASGQIVAIKGIGGYLLTCAANDDAAVARLRQRKHRPSKPLAVMYPNLETIKAHYVLSSSEEAMLTGYRGAIVLLRPQADVENSLSDYIAPGLDRIGVMLPYAAHFQLLLNAYGRPIVVTSGNLSGEPIVFRDADLVDRLGGMADVLVTHNRQILVPQDDSVAVFSAQEDLILLRRARGYAPTFFCRRLELTKDTVLAAGADLKAAFCLHQSGNTYVSQYLGDLTSYSAQQNYRQSLDHLRKVMRVQPAVVLADKHPGYAATQLAETTAGEENLPLKYIPHHEAHFAAVLGEHNLINSSHPVLGVIWDGTGLGTDGELWGGEFFHYQNHSFHRLGHLSYAPVIAGDKMAREPRLSAFSLTGDLPFSETLLRPKFTATEWRFYLKASTQASQYTSSMGRLFDAVGCLLGLGDVQDHEGMVATRLEALAREGMTAELQAYEVRLDDQNNLPVGSLLALVISDLSAVTPATIAARFHLSLVSCIRQMAIRNGIKDIAFSGGVFQNSLLVSLLQQKMGQDFELYFHLQLSPNDENIAFGQLVHYAIEQRRIAAKQEEHVLSHTR